MNDDVNSQAKFVVRCERAKLIEKITERGRPIRIYSIGTDANLYGEAIETYIRETYKDADIFNNVITINGVEIEGFAPSASQGSTLIFIDTTQSNDRSYVIGRYILREWDKLQVQCFGYGWVFPETADAKEFVARSTKKELELHLSELENYVPFHLIRLTEPESQEFPDLPFPYAAILIETAWILDAGSGRWDDNLEKKFKEQADAAYKINTDPLKDGDPKRIKFTKTWEKLWSISVPLRKNYLAEKDRQKEELEGSTKEQSS